MQNLLKLPRRTETEAEMARVIRKDKSWIKGEEEEEEIDEKDSMRVASDRLSAPTGFALCRHKEFSNLNGDHRPM